ncbi:MAG: hypothetical protein KatS3mg114_0764 [Planctomycetaceae bacterium]|nr:MAG: hypothetical protein KatS3mg114_0764 [Planctomycetaceae bacterium]
MLELPLWRTQVLVAIQVAVLCLACAPPLVGEPILPEKTPWPFKTGAALHHQLQSPLMAAWEQVELRQLLRRVQNEYGVAIFLDRRIDPTQRCDVRWTGEVFLEGMRRLAQQCGASVSVSDHVVYLGPSETATWLQTGIEIAEWELASPALQVDAARRQELLRGFHLSWPQYTTSRQALQLVREHYGLQVEHEELLIHDVWPEVSLPQVTAAEALCLLLWPLELGWRWLPTGHGIRLERWQPPPRLAREYPLSSSQQARWVPAWKTAFPEATFESLPQGVRVLARAEEHRLIRQWQAMGSPPTSAHSTRLNPLSRRQFTLSAQRIPLHTILEELQRSGVQVEYDAAELERCGISLETPITLEVVQVPAELFFRKLLEPVGLQAELDGYRLVLKPRPR